MVTVTEIGVPSGAAKVGVLALPPAYISSIPVCAVTPPPEQMQALLTSPITPVLLAQPLKSPTLLPALGAS